MITIMILIVVTLIIHIAVILVIANIITSTTITLLRARVAEVVVLQSKLQELERSQGLGGQKHQSKKHKYKIAHDI